MYCFELWYDCMQHLIALLIGVYIGIDKLRKGNLSVGCAEHITP